jgi:predicted dehydrogenase
VSGGLAVDCGIHEFDLIEWLTGRSVTRVLARPLPVVDESLAVVGDVDNLVVLVELDDGAVATVDLSRNARYADDVRTEVLGSNGALFVEMLPAGRLRIGGPDGIKRLVEADAEDAMAAGVAEQARAFVRRIKGGNGPVPGAGEANRALAIALAARESADRGTWVGLAGAVSG